MYPVAVFPLNRRGCDFLCIKLRLFISTTPPFARFFPKRHLPELIGSYRQIESKIAYKFPVKVESTQRRQKRNDRRQDGFMPCLFNRLGLWKGNQLQWILWTTISFRLRWDDKIAIRSMDGKNWAALVLQFLSFEFRASCS